VARLDEIRASLASKDKGQQPSGESTAAS
jgi:hypothetical protein